LKDFRGLQGNIGGVFHDLGVEILGLGDFRGVSYDIGVKGLNFQPQTGKASTNCKRICKSRAFGNLCPFDIFET
jgi:hypothetical protein